MGGILINTRRYLAALRATLPFRDSEENPVLLITGSGRSGTTWIAEVLRNFLSARLVFEPLRPGTISALSNLKNRQYLRPGTSETGLYSGLQTVVNGKFRSRWTDRYNNKIVYNNRVIKEIRANLMVGWILNEFPHVRVIHIVRDPLATVTSQLKGEWEISLEKFTEQSELVDDYLHEFEDIVHSAVSPEQKGIIHWAIENYVPINQYESNKWPRGRFAVFSYSRLRDSDNEMAELLAFAKVPVESIDWGHIRAPSRVSRGKTKFTNLPDQQGQLQALRLYSDRAIEKFGLRQWIS